ncbi:MAG: DUF4411 family protein [Bacteroidia bacterium]
MIYLIDSNTLMTAARTYYSFEFGNNFWDFLLEKAKTGQIKSIDKVYDEIQKGNDKLKEWTERQFVNYFSPTDNINILYKYADLVNWAENQDQYSRNAKNEFMNESNADVWLLAFAMQDPQTYKIVSFEKFNTNIKKKIPIPNACAKFNIQYCDLFEMMRDLEFRF